MMAATNSTNWKNVNNWHWVEKNCFPWAKDHVTSKLVGLSSAANGGSASITAVSSFTGDADINQRKGKLITVYDVAFTLEWKGTSASGKDATGKITVPELMHDTNLDSLEVEINVSPDTAETAPIKDAVRKELIPQMKKVLSTFSKDMIEANGKDVHIPESEMKGHPVTELYKPQPPAPSVVSSAASKSKPSNVLGHLTTLNMTVEFVCSAGDLYLTLLDQGRVSAWSRGPAKISPQVGAEIVLFGGNVTGSILELVPNKKIVQSWRLKTWPSEHHSNVTLELEEQRESVKLKVTQKDVPIGEVDIVRRNWEGYYWNGIKATFGYGAVGF